MSAVGKPTLERIALEMVPELREHLGASAVLLHQYLKHAWLERGVKVFAQHGRQVLAEMHRIARRMVGMGGVPGGDMLELVNYAYLEPEPVQRLPLEQLLHNDLQLELRYLARLEHSLEVADGLGDAPSSRLLRGAMERSRERIGRLRGYLKPSSN